MTALFQLDPRGFPHIFQKGDPHVAEISRGTLGPQVFRLEIAVIEAVQEKIH